MKTWRQVKDARILKYGKYCEECHKRFDRNNLVGHHVLPRKFIKKYGLYLVELCRLRCKRCEKMMHSKYPLGNDIATTATLQSILSKFGRSEYHDNS